MGRTIGILGGMGTAAGIHFAQRLVDLNHTATGDKSHPAFILYSNPSIPDRGSAYLYGTHSPVTNICFSLNKLAYLGADFGVLICNTAHIYFDDIVQNSKLPLINMVASVAEMVEKMPLSKIGLLATSATVSSRLYHDYLAPSGIDVFTPDQNDQIHVDRSIYDPVIGIKSTGNRINSLALDLLEHVTERMHREFGIEHFILGCTELSMIPICGRLEKFQFVDPVSLLAERCLSSAGFL
ncbi:aspartate/glutamate racemase family protein [Massilia aurea]|uniref:aspartate/glutamate racemase family protein n=1 Tax=Massilia aurea TaxID=373040 RepID=UPI0021636386|nr:amino acid racemase [Massilia aurea]MCS0709962.1 amino acid racemase [Massilia aurea]